MASTRTKSSCNARWRPSREMEEFFLSQQLQFSLSQHLMASLTSLSTPAQYEKWPNASMKGIDSMSPIVPPSSMTQTSAGSSVPSTVVFHL